MGLGGGQEMEHPIGAHRSYLWLPQDRGWCHRAGPRPLSRASLTPA